MPVIGIAEWWNWYAGDAPECDQPTAIDECIEVHRALGVEQIVWNCGRALVAQAAATLPKPAAPNHPAGCDWHAVRHAVGGLKAKSPFSLRAGALGRRAL